MLLCVGWGPDVPKFKALSWSRSQGIGYSHVRETCLVIRPWVCLESMPGMLMRC